MLKAIRWIIIICSVETDTLAVPTSPEHSRAGYCWHQFIQAVKNYSKGCILNKSSLNTQLAPSQPTLGADISAESKGQGSQLPSAFSFASCKTCTPQHKHLHHGGCSSACLCYCTSRGCWVIQSVISAQRSRAKETQKHIQQFWGAFPQLHNSLSFGRLHKEVAVVLNILF